MSARPVHPARPRTTGVRTPLGVASVKALPHTPSISVRRALTACAACSLALLTACGTVAQPPGPQALFVSEAEADHVRHTAEGWSRIGASAHASSGRFVETTGAPLGTSDSVASVASVAFSVARDGEYSLWLRAASAADAPITVGVGFDHDLRPLVVPPNGGFAWYEATRDVLTAGEQVITFEAGPAGMRFDLFAVVEDADMAIADLEGLVSAAPRVAEPSSHLRGDPAFDRSQLPSDAAAWHARVIASITSPSADIDALRLARSDDLYEYGRTLQIYVQAVALAFELTGDLALLDHLDDIAEGMRSRLSDAWRGTLDGTDGTRDGFVNWVWRYSSDDAYVGKDTNVLDEMKTHAMVAMIATALDANRDLVSPGGRDYAASADFWRDYLVNTFEAKWRAREGIETGFPILSKPHMNTHLAWTKWHFYMGELTGDDAYTAEAHRMADRWWDQIRSVGTDSGVAYVWPRSSIDLGGREEFLSPTVYASGIYADLVQLHFAGFHRWADPEELRAFARTFTTFVMDDRDPMDHGLAPDVGGGRARAGIASEGEDWPRMTAHGFSLSGFSLLAAWDATGRIAGFGDEAYDGRGSNLGLVLEVAGLVEATSATLAAAAR